MKASWITTLLAGIGLAAVVALPATAQGQTSAPKHAAKHHGKMAATRHHGKMAMRRHHGKMATMRRHGKMAGMKHHGKMAGMMRHGKMAAKKKAMGGATK